MDWLLLRGLGREKKHWFDFPDKLQKVSSCVQMIDLPGVGEENWTSAPLTIQGNTEFLRKKYFRNQKPNATEPTGLIGISLGGMIAMDWASRYPEDFKKLVLINVSAKDTSPILNRISPYGLYCLAKATATKNLKQKEYALLKMVSNLKVKDAQTLQNMIALAEKSKVSNLAISKQLAAAAQFISPDSMTIPTLYLASIKDRMVDVRCSKSLADKYHAQIKFHPTAGHDLTLDDPDWAVTQIDDFART